MFRYLNIFSFLLFSITVNAQNPIQGRETRITLEGQVFSAIITEDGDTLILADLDNVSITALRKFNNDDEYRKYMRFRNYALRVYPYAKEAIRIYRELEYASLHLSKKEKKKKLKELEVQLTAEFEEPLKNLTKLQGKIMIKMIEKEINKPIYYLIKEVKGGFNAFYWHQFSKLYSYDLKEGYNRGDYPILDAVLQDFDVSYRIENETNMKYIKINRSESK
ncbi:MAG: DUF4294 domain-containing protein [Saprospiraceae bacterium]|nr:DUF4294 domain-containing protein [Saprospiraceae bacterium]